MRIAGIIVFVFSVSFGLFAQTEDDSLKKRDLNQVDIYGKQNKYFKAVSLYDAYDFDTTENINGFRAVNIYRDELSDEVWKTENVKCIEIKRNETNPLKGKACLNVTWDKTNGGCDWIGLGFGWDYWSGKDMSPVVENSAIEMYIRSNRSSMPTIPGAIGFEDYAGKQAWIGMGSAIVDNKKITQEWTKVTIPLQLFPFENNGVDIMNIKQVVIQFETEGQIDIDEMKIVPFTGKLIQSIDAKMILSPAIIDGEISKNEWDKAFTAFQDIAYQVKYDEENLYFLVKVKDKTPLQNAHAGNDLYKGDAIEIAFGSNPNSKKSRNFLLMSDLHLGIKCSDKPIVWNFKTKTEVVGSKVNTKKTEDGYLVEFQLPITQLTQRKLTFDTTHSFEIVVDFNKDTIDREKQERWNKPDTDGFYNNPSLWGEIKLK